MSSLFPVLLLGTVLGIRHALDADHLVAVSTILTGQRKVSSAMRIGALWGLGHTVTILVVGGAIVALHLAIPPRLGLAMEFVVALMLIGLGAYNLLGGSQGPPGALTAVRPVLIGVVHGLAGSAAVALLVVATISDPIWAAGYLLLFGGGTILGMMAATATVAAPIALATERWRGARRSLQLASGTLSVGLGGVLAAHLTLVDGLFRAVPH